MSALAGAGPRGTLSVRLLDAGEPVAGVIVDVVGATSAHGTTDAEGRVTFSELPAGAYRLSAGAFERPVTIANELETLHLDIGRASPVDAGRFGRSDINREDLARLPNAGAASSVLETLEPFAVTNRIDVAGVESATDPLWSVRGSSWTTNRVRLDGLDVTDPAGGAALLYPDVGLFEEVFFLTAAHGPETAGPGTELRFITRSAAPSPSLGGSLSLRATGDALQSRNLDAERIALGIEPREMRRYVAARFELGAPRFYASASGLDMATRIPKFEPEERFDLATAMGKLTGERLSLLALLQRAGRPTFGAHPDFAPETTVDVRETFQVVQTSVRTSRASLRFGLARGDLEPAVADVFATTPVRDLATGAVAGAPPVVTERARTRWSAAGTGARAFERHTLRAGFELSHATESVSESVPGGLERLLVDGEAHAVSLYAGDVTRRVGLSRVALYAQDAFFFDFLGRPFRLSPGVRLDDSRGGGIGWTHLSGSLRGGMALTPSFEIHFGAGIYPHVLTTEPYRADETLSWIRRRWSDANGDGEPTADELGEVLRRGGGDYTTLAAELPRPVTYEITVGVEKRFGRGFLRFSGYHRWEKQLLQSVNVGVDPASYRTFFFHDVGIDGVLDSPDDVDIPVYDQRAQLGEDAFLLTHPVGLDSMAQGVDLLLGFDHGRVSWRLSGRAYRDVGSGNPGNEAAENDTGVIGTLFDDPNTLTNANGRLFFDRAFTGKLALIARAPLGLRLGAAVRYWDGQPFARHLFFPDLGQGFTRVQAFPRGRLRYAFNMTVDVRAEREIQLGRLRLDLTLDAFNLFNQSLHTAEVTRSGMQFRDPTFVQPARTVVLEVRFRF